MKATIISPVLSDTKPLAVCVVIPFDTIELSIALNSGVTNITNGAKWLNKNDVRVFEKNTDKDITSEVLGSDDNHTYDGQDLTLIMNKVTEYQKNVFAKVLSPEIQEQIHCLQCLKDAIIEKKGNRFAYLKELNSNGFMGWEIEDKELNKEVSDFVLNFCSNKIDKLKKNNL